MRFITLSFGLLGVAILSLVLSSTLFDASLGGMSLAAQRAVGVVTLFLPAAAGTVLGVLGFIRAPPRRALAAVATALNSLFALFFAAVLTLAG